MVLKEDIAGMAVGHEDESSPVRQLRKAYVSTVILMTL